MRKVVTSIQTDVKTKRKARAEDKMKRFDSFDEQLIERTVHRLHKEKKFVSLNDCLKRSCLTFMLMFCSHYFSHPYNGHKTYCRWSASLLNGYLNLYQWINLVENKLFEE